jgi:hypothetical protein
MGPASAGPFFFLDASVFVIPERISFSVVIAGLDPAIHAEGKLIQICR